MLLAMTLQPWDLNDKVLACLRNPGCGCRGQPPKAQQARVGRWISSKRKLSADPGKHFGRRVMMTS